MTAVVAENRPHEFLAIRLVGCVHGGVDDTSSEQAASNTKGGLAAAP
jgi:hypothetical protein